MKLMLTHTSSYALSYTFSYILFFMQRILATLYAFRKNSISDGRRISEHEIGICRILLTEGAITEETFESFNHYIEGVCTGIKLKGLIK